MKYNNSESNYNGQYNHIPRGWLIFAQIAGTIFSIIGLITFIYYMQNIYRALPGDNLTQKSLIALILAVIVYFVWRSIYTAWVIVRLVNKSSDEELCANRYIISALSLSVGGFFTPFLITSFPNVTTISTIKPRYFLSKTMGFCILIGAPILALTYFLPLLVGINAVSSINLIFNTTSTMGKISIVILTVTFITFIFGLVTTSSFFSKNTSNAFDNNNPSKLLKLISTIWMAILTVELIIIILFSFLRLIGALGDFFRAGQKNGESIMMIFALLNLFITISYVGMVIYVTTRTITGLWSNDGTVKIGHYQHNKFAKTRLMAANNY